MKNSNNDNSQNFLDSRTLVSILLVGAIFFGWQMYMQKKYPENFAKKAVTASGTIGAHTEPGESPKGTTIPGATPPDTPAAIPSTEQTVHYASENLAFDISSQGMGVRTFQILKYKNRQGDTVELGHPSGNILPLETRLLGHTEPLNFKIEQVNPNLFVGHAEVGAVKVTKTMEIDPEKYTFNFKVVASGSDDHFIGLSTALAEDVVPQPTGTKYQNQEFFFEAGDSKDRTTFGKDDVQKSYSKVKIAAVGSQYFTEAIIDNSQIMPDAKAQVRHGNKDADVVLQYPVLNKGQDFQLEYKAFVGPKAMSLLKQVDEGLTRVVDFGFFNTIGRYIFELLKIFYGMVGNWGVAIILLTIVVRLVVLPVNLYSYKSMRAMQAIQPQIAALKERYKNDQQKQQQEMMLLMKTNKVNPVGGCLPVMLQMPIFFALYRVLGNSIELYQAPFVLWIHDLSLKDPFYILPVLMGLTMFVQQKITPNTIDPAQAKMLMFMPLIFTFFMASLPSGLTIYMLIGAVFSVLQQLYFMKQPKTLSSGIK